MNLPWRSARFRLALALAAAAIVVVGVVVFGDDGRPPGAALGRVPARLITHEPTARELAPYRGLGAWVDVFDFARAYQAPGREPSLSPTVVDEMANLGVNTLFLQAARDDARSPDMLADRELVAHFLVRAHRRGMRVVGWYLPRFGQSERDLHHLEAIAGFSSLGHRFDGVAVDIEYTEDVADHAVRSDSLVALSRRLRAAAGRETLGAIVLPPVQTEVVNPQKWPEFPWRELADLYDVWLPMSYWTFRSEESGYHDGRRYNVESVRRLRTNLGDASAPVHAIGGIGDKMRAADLDRFLESLAEVRAVGGSIYDWDTLSSERRRHLGRVFASSKGGED